MAGNNNLPPVGPQPEQITTHIKFGYNAQANVVLIQISPFVSVSLPFEAFQNGYYAIKRMRQQAKITLPQSKIQES